MRRNRAFRLPWGRFPGGHKAERRVKRNAPSGPVCDEGWPIVPNLDIIEIMGKSQRYIGLRIAMPPGNSLLSIK